MSGANADDSLRFRPADTASLPMVEDEQSYRMGEVIVPNISEGLGLMLTGESNMVGDMHPEGPGAQGGLMVGDVIMAVDDRVVTSVGWRPSEDAGVVLCKEPHALEPAGLALDRTKPSVTLKVLRPVELRREETAPPSLAEEIAAARGHVPVGQEVPSPQRPPAQPPMYVAEQRPPTQPPAYVAEQRPPTAQERVPLTLPATSRAHASSGHRGALWVRCSQRSQHKPAQSAQGEGVHSAHRCAARSCAQAQMTAQVHAMYPWATQIPTADGGMKNKYNLAQGTTLQPLQPLQPLDPDATMRKAAAFAAPLGRN